MDLDGLTIAPADDTDYLVAVDFIWQGGPVAGRLFYADFVPALEAAGRRETAPALVGNQHQAVGWLFWPTGEEVARDPSAPWQPRVYMLGPHVGMQDALAQALALLEDRQRPSGTREDSLREIDAMLDAEADYALLPRHAAKAGARLRKSYGLSRAGIAGR